LLVAKRADEKKHFLCILVFIIYIIFAAVLGGRLAVSCNPPSAIAGLNSSARLSVSPLGWRQVVLKAMSYTMETHEPGQTLTGAALSDDFHVL